MTEHHEVAGIIRKAGSRISIEISDVSERVGALDSYDEGQPVRLMIWDARPHADRSDLEQVSERQQLPKEVVAQGLRTRGSIQNKADFLQKLLSTNP